MGRVVVVHGIGQQYKGEHELLADWVPALRDGVTRAGFPDLVRTRDVAAAFYGDLFRPTGRTLAVGLPLFTAEDVDSGLEEDLLLEWWAEAARVDPEVVPPDASTLVRTPRSVQAALRALSGSQFFAGLTIRMMVADLKEVAQYLSNRGVRAKARDRLTKVIGADTAVVVGHSLGSVVAYEALCSLQDHRVQAFVTLGSPLGIRRLITDRLEPAPVSGVGVWPGSSGMIWTNLADEGDVVALEKDLRTAFGPRVRGRIVNNGSRAHAVGPYLTARETGQAIAEGLVPGLGSR